MKYLTKVIQGVVLWCMLFTDDRYVLVEKSPDEENGRLNQWRGTLEGKILKISRGKTDYIKYNFGEREHGQVQLAIREWQIIQFSGDVVGEIGMFKYVGSPYYRRMVFGGRYEIQD